MGIYELNDLADQFERLIDHADKYQWDREQLIKQIGYCVNQLREEADILANEMAAHLEEQASEFAYYQQFA